MLPSRLRDLEVRAGLQVQASLEVRVGNPHRHQQAQGCLWLLSGLDLRAGQRDLSAQRLRAAQVHLEALDLHRDRKAPEHQADLVHHARRASLRLETQAGLGLQAGQRDLWGQLALFDLAA